MFLGRDQHGLAFLNWVQHFLAIFIKVHEFLQNSVFSPRSARFVNSALGASLYSNYQQNTRVCTKESFKPDFGTFSHCRTGYTTFERFSAKCTSLYNVQNSVFCPRSPRFVILTFSYWAQYLLATFSKVHEFVQNRTFQPEISTFCHFRTGRTTF